MSEYAIRLDDSGGVVFWGPYPSESDAYAVGNAFIAVPETWRVIPAEEAPAWPHFDAMPT